MLQWKFIFRAWTFISRDHWSWFPFFFFFFFFQIMALLYLVTVWSGCFLVCQQHPLKSPYPPSFVIRKHALAMLQSAPADPLAALEEKYRSKMLQQQHAAAIGSKETTKRSRRIWCFFGEGQGSGKQSFVGYFVSLSALKGSRRFGMIWPSCQVDKKWSCQSCRRICQRCARKISMKKMLN